VGTDVFVMLIIRDDAIVGGRKININISGIIVIIGFGGQIGGLVSLHGRHGDGSAIRGDTRVDITVEVGICDGVIVES